MKFGKLQQRFYAEQPPVYDKETKTAYLNIEEGEQTEHDTNSSEEGTSKVIKGYTAYPVLLDGLMDYGHIKSQLIEAAYPPKDEFGFAMNALDVLFGTQIDGKEMSEYSDEIEETRGFLEYRTLCAKVAREIVSEF